MPAGYPECFLKLARLKYIAFGYLLFLVIVTLIPLGQMNHTLNDNYTLNIRWDYLLHALVYMPMVVLMGFGFINKSEDLAGKQASPFRFWISIVIIGLCIAALLEVFQLIIPYRRFNINDMLANGIGVIIGLSLIPLFRKVIARFYSD